MITITEQKPFEEIMQSLGKAKKVYLIGCGTCATICHTGGRSELMDMKARLEEAGKKVTGWMVVPTSCDELVKYALEEQVAEVKKADVILAMTCAFGVHTISLYADKPVNPALNTLFIGKEEAPGHFIEVCMQCGNCVLATTVGICPLVRCAKSLLNGPCGGSVEGKCEISPDIPCAWQLIYDRLAALGKLDELEELVPLRDWSASREGGPRRIIL